MKTMVVAILGTCVAVSANDARARPAWCKGTVGTESFWITNSDGSFKYRSEADDVAMDGFSSIVLALCSSDAQVEPLRPQLEAARLRWSKRMHLTDADWADALPFATEMLGDRRGMRLDLRGRHDSIGEMTPLEQYDMFRTEDVLSQIHLADIAGSHLSMSGRLGYIARCVEAEELDPVTNAICGHDIATFDMDKLNAELRADATDPPEGKMTLRLVYDVLVRERLPKRMATLRALVAKDEGYGKLFAIAKKTSAEWEANQAELASLREEAWQLFEANETGSRKARAGCEQQTYGRLVEAIQSISASDYQAVYKSSNEDPTTRLLRRVMITPKGFLTVANFATCVAGQEQAPVFTETARELASQPGYTGPRSAVLTNILAANIELDRGSLVYPKPTQGFYRDSAPHAFGTGVIKKAKLAGPVVHLEFTSIMTKVESCTGGFVDTRRIIGVRNDGTFIFESRCTGYSMVNSDSASHPMDVAASLAPGIKPGMTVVADGNTVILAWEPKAKAPSVVLGQAVK